MHMIRLTFPEVPEAFFTSRLYSVRSQNTVEKLDFFIHQEAILLRLQFIKDARLNLDNCAKQFRCTLLIKIKFRKMTRSNWQDCPDLSCITIISISHICFWGCRCNGICAGILSPNCCSNCHEK